MPRSAALRPLGLGLALVGLALAAAPGSSLALTLAGLTTALAVGLPLALSSSRWAEPLLVVLSVLLVVFAAWAPYARATGSGSERDRTHDGGVVVTRESAWMVLRGENPYVERYDRVVDETWRLVEGSDGTTVANPVLHRQPYLPLAFLVQVPFLLVTAPLDLPWDPRMLGWATLTAAVVVAARRPGPAWTRLGAVLAVGNAFTLTYLAWGTNDAFAACLFVLALLFAERRPAVAASLLAVAISAKFLLLVGLVPLGVVVWRRGGAAALRAWWPLPALLAASTLPFLAWDAGAFLDDALWFNLGRTEPKMPTSGLGLPATAPDLFQGPLLLLATGLLTLGALAVAALVAWRRPSVVLVGPLTALALVGLLLPARTFQINYLVLVVVVASTGWLLGPRSAAADPTAGAERDLAVAS